MPNSSTILVNAKTWCFLKTVPHQSKCNRVDILDLLLNDTNRSHRKSEWRHAPNPIRLETVPIRFRVHRCRWS